MSETFEFIVTDYTSSEGHVPTPTEDSQGKTYEAWELSDDITFTYPVPGTYIAGSALILYLELVGPTASKKFKFRAAVTMVRPSDATTDSKDIDTEFTNPGVATMPMTRSLLCSTAGGLIDTTALAGGDVVTVTLSRIAASSLEEPDPIRVYSYNLKTLVTSTRGLCLGRVKEIIANVRALFNDDAGEQISSDLTILGWINQCKKKIAKAGYFRTTEYFDSTVDIATYDLRTILTDYKALISIAYYDGSVYQEMQPVPNRSRLVWLQTDTASSIISSYPLYYYLDGSSISVYPAPASTLVNAFRAWFEQTSDDLGCTSGYTPVTPVENDMVFVYFALKQAFMRKKHNPKAGDLVGMYNALYLQELADLMGDDQPLSLEFRPYR